MAEMPPNMCQKMIENYLEDISAGNTSRGGHLRSAPKQKNGPSFRLITVIIIEKNEYRYIVFVSHLFQHPHDEFHCNSKISFLKIGTQQECRKKIIEIFNEKPRRLQKTFARLAGINQKQFLR